MTSSELASIHALVVDVDGVLWQGRRNLPGVAAFFAFLRDHRIRFVIATNNAARPISEIVDRLGALGVPLSEDQVLTSAQATALYLPRVVPPGARVLVVGGEGLVEAVLRAGYELVDRDAEIVVAGYDPGLTYEKLKQATLAIRRGAKFVGTNADKTIPTDEGILPGAGAILAAIQAATDVAPIVIGKPERAMFDVAVDRLQSNRQETAMLGDRLDTDIEGAQAAGLRSILVLTGVSSRESLEHSKIQPEFVAENLETLRETWLRAY
jgi:4-nitrophenyl phosphatase